MTVTITTTMLLAGWWWSSLSLSSPMLSYIIVIVINRIVVIIVTVIANAVIYHCRRWHHQQCHHCHQHQHYRHRCCHCHRHHHHHMSLTFIKSALSADTVMTTTATSDLSARYVYKQKITSLCSAHVKSRGCVSANSAMQCNHTRAQQMLWSVTLRAVSRWPKGSSWFCKMEATICLPTLHHEWMRMAP